MVVIVIIIIIIILIICNFFIHSFHWHVQNAMIPCRSQELFPFLSVLYVFLPPFSTTILPSSLTSSCHLFFGLPLKLVFPKFMSNTLLGILFSSILCTCPNQRNLFNLIVSIIVRFLTLTKISLLVNILQFSFSLSYTGPKILLYTFLSKMFNFFLSLLVSKFLMHMLTFYLLLLYVNVLSIIVFFSHNFSFFDMFLFFKNFCSIKYVW